MRDFLSSKYTSLACALINFALAFNAILDGSWTWAVVSTGLGVFCYRNYYKAIQ